MNDYYSLSQEDSDAAREYREYVESTYIAPEWYLIERAFKDGICHAKGIQYNFLNDYDKDMMKLIVKRVKEQKEFNKNIMESNTFMMPIGGKSILRSTGEEVEVIDFNLPNRGMRTNPKDLTFEEGDLVTYIDSEGKEHIKEHLNIQLDFKSVANDTFCKLLDIVKPNKYPTERNRRIFEVAKALYLDNERDYSIDMAVQVATYLVDTIGIEII